MVWVGNPEGRSVYVSDFFLFQKTEDFRRRLEAELQTQVLERNQKQDFKTRQDLEQNQKQALTSVSALYF